VKNNIDIFVVVYYSGDQIRKKMGRECCMYGREERCRFFGDETRRKV
jgi:hypothetical protein